MKKMILAAAALMMAAAHRAQMPSFEWGVKAGLNVSGISNIDDSKMKASIYVGAFAEFHVNDWLGIQPEVSIPVRDSLLMITVSITPVLV